MGQSMAILRYLGLRFGYYSTDPMEMWLIDSTVDAVQEIFSKFEGAYFSLSPDMKQTAFKSLIEQGGPLRTFMAAMEKRLKPEGSYILGSALTIADFALGALFFATFFNETSPYYQDYR